MMQATIGFCAYLRAAAMAVATSRTSVVVVGTHSTITVSIPGSPSTRGSTASNVFAVAPASRSRGLCRDRARHGEPEGLRGAASNGGTSRPRASHASAVRTPGPPAFVTMATRLPTGPCCVVSSVAASKSSSSVDDAHDARLGQERVDQDVLRRERPGVRARGARAGDARDRS